MCKESVASREKETAERKLDELHEYVRHIFQMFVGWFTFFGTVNYATMGWLAKVDTGSSHNNKMIIAISLLFITQNLLGIVVCFVLKNYLFLTNKIIEGLERKIMEITVSGDEELGSMPVRFYQKVIYLVVFALSMISVVWCFIPFAA